MSGMPRVLALASIAAACACAPDDREEEPRCAPADFEVIAAPGPMPGPCVAQTDRGADGTIDAYEKWVYDEAGRESWIELGDTQGPSVQFEFGYDAQGRMTSRISVDPSTGAMTSRWDREYVSESEAIDTTSSADGAISAVSRLEFDARGNVMLTLSDDDNDHRTDWRNTSSYDADDRILESSVERLLHDWTLWYGYQYEYDDDGFLVTRHYDYEQPSSSQHDGITHYTNDRWGNELVAEHIDLEDREHTCTYAFYACDE